MDSISTIDAPAQGEAMSKGHVSVCHSSIGEWAYFLIVECQLLGWSVLSHVVECDRFSARAFIKRGGAGGGSHQWHVKSDFVLVERRTITNSARWAYCTLVWCFRMPAFQKNNIRRKTCKFDTWRRLLVITFSPLQVHPFIKRLSTPQVMLVFVHAIFLFFSFLFRAIWREITNS